MRPLVLLLAIAAGLWPAGPARSSDLIYHPIDPAFGGSPFNGTFLLGVAEANNSYSAPPAKPKSFKQRLNDAIENRLISALAQQVTDKLSGKDAADSGSFVLGDGTKVDFVKNPDTGEVDVTITDPQGTETHITFQS